MSGGSNTVYVGNLLPGTTEQQLAGVVGNVGRVLHIKIHDGTGKTDYGFVTYADPETAESAIRHLNGVDFNGRSLRINKATRDVFPTSSSYTAPKNASLSSSSSSSSSSSHRMDVDTKAPSDPPPSSELVSKIVKAMSRSHRLEVLTEMKKFIAVNPTAAKQLLVESPHLAQSILQIELLFNLVKPQDVPLVLQNHQPSMTSAPSLPTHNGIGVALEHIPMFANMSKEEQGVLRQVLELPEDQIAMLPQEVQAQVFQVRQQLNAPRGMAM